MDFEFWVSGVGCWVLGVGFVVFGFRGCGFRVSGLGFVFLVFSFRFLVSGFGCQVSDFGFGGGRPPTCSQASPRATAPALVHAPPAPARLRFEVHVYISGGVWSTFYAVYGLYFMRCMGHILRAQQHQHLCVRPQHLRVWVSRCIVHVS